MFSIFSFANEDSSLLSRTSASVPERSRPRRVAHRKSRLGCVRCKQLRVKCNELRPSCSRCFSSSSQCVYLTQRPAAANNDTIINNQQLPVDDKVIRPASVTRRIIIPGRWIPQKDASSDVSTPASDTSGADWASFGDSDDPPAEDYSVVTNSTALSSIRRKQSPPTEFPSPSFSPHGQPQAWNRVETEFMVKATHYSNQITNRNGHLLIAEYLIPHNFRLAFQSPSVRYSWLSFMARKLRISDDAAATRRLVMHFRLRAIESLRQETAIFNEDTCEAILAATILLARTMPEVTAKETTIFEDYCNKVYDQILTLTGRPPFDMPDLAEFMIDPLFLSIDHDFGLTRWHEDHFLRFKRLLKGQRDIQLAVTNLELVLTNLPTLLHKSRTNAKHRLKAHSALWYMSFMPNTITDSLGTAKPEARLLVGFYMATQLLVAVLRPDWSVCVPSDYQAALALRRIHCSLLEEDDNIWTGFSRPLDTMASMFLTKGTIRPPGSSIVTTYQLMVSSSSTSSKCQSIAWK